MIEIRRSAERGHADHGWLKSRHSFSFAEYQDPRFVHFGPLRVINEDWIAPGQGFGMHGHRDMEIITYVLSGAISHRDSMGNASVIRPGHVQRMSAGIGVRHSEHNHEPVETHMLQIWIIPEQAGGEPSYQEAPIDRERQRGALQLIASPHGGGGAVTIGQDASLWAGCFDGDESAELEIRPGRRIYAHLARGACQVNGVLLAAGDALLITDQDRVAVDSGAEAELLIFDLP
jgi:redox-sensitive bicupin YhaK (pirin superfamily)